MSITFLIKSPVKNTTIFIIYCIHTDHHRAPQPFLGLVGSI